MDESTNIGSLLTTFIPYSTCVPQDNIWCIFPESFGGSYWQYGPPLQSNCFPPGYHPETTAYYSPGRCPVYYTSVHVSTVTSGTVTETVATCCPSGLTLTANRADARPYTNYPSLSVSTMACTGQFNQDISWPTVTRSSAGKTMESSATWVSGSGGVQAFGIIIRYQSTDLFTQLSAITSFTQSPNPSLAASTPTSTSTQNLVSTAATAKAEGLSMQEKVTIGVGVSLGVLVLLLTAALTHLLSNRRKRKKSSASATTDVDVSCTPATPATTSASCTPELQAHPVEVASTGQRDLRLELESLPGSPHEMPAAELSLRNLKDHSKAPDSNRMPQ